MSWRQWGRREGERGGQRTLGSKRERSTVEIPIASAPINASRFLRMSSASRPIFAKTSSASEFEETREFGQVQPQTRKIDSTWTKSSLSSLVRTPNRLRMNSLELAPRNIYVLNLPQSCNRQQLFDFYSKFGSINHLCILATLDSRGRSVSPFSALDSWN